LHDVFAALIKLRSNDLYKDVFITNQITSNLSGGFKWIQVNTDSSKLCVIGNFDVVSQSANITFPEAGTWYDYLNGTTITTTGTAQSITLEPGEYHVYLNRNVVSTVTTPVSSINASGNNLSIKVYPNPVAQNSTIDLNIPESGNVRIDLVNIMGQQSQNIKTGFLSKGHYTINLNKNKSLPAGVYLLKVNTNATAGTVKIILK
jgi:hypothetical protein